ncbi:MAG: gfo/Idh/MocA family oxidoreductase, partial [Mangrovicoccus sp.]|nr:gfo/Idh/MocA family oxidoreductase [Mangrovicoccus sp.]
RLAVCLGEDMLTGTWREVATPPVPPIYQRFVEAARGDGPSDPDFARGAALQAVLDAAETDGLGGFD